MAGCYEIDCKADSFEIKIGHTTAYCGKNTHPEANNVVDEITGFVGEVRCPSYDLVCGD
jgi:hypothetical protein